MKRGKDEVRQKETKKWSKRDGRLKHPKRIRWRDRVPDTEGHRKRHKQIVREGQTPPK